MRPNRTRPSRRRSGKRNSDEIIGSRSYRRKPKHNWLFRLIWKLIFLVCLVSALPMLALRFFDPPTSSFIELNKLNNNPNIQHQWVDIDNISLYFPLAVVASEDQQFPNHFGFDFKQIRLVLEESENGLSRGASTLSQQTVKNLFLWPERSLLRKGIEAWLVLWMELIVPKKRILEIYVNYAQFGKSIFGVEAASQAYFGIAASELGPEQSALITASLPTPSKSNPAKPSEYLQSRADFILDQMPRIGGRQLIRDL
ncbi:MAG: monofunctional biosynthetic peptidoglycan transglycosylase [Acidiferrobacterales bacterium]|nr:monofunctional biosynthetic peptidoglycan transglycosylase [Acidiferrobacterales bacterium]